jgi:UDP-3-O-[3-hydroxymyristoyl] N-acetylglucosamine deacetylase
VTSQTTLAGPVEFAGVGIHTGQKGRVRVCPAPAGYGVRFLIDGVEVPAVAEHVVSTQRCTVLGFCDGETRGRGDGATKQDMPFRPVAPSPARPVSVSTVEHLMAALYGLGIDNARVEVDGPELPIVDGSALPFVEGVLSVGLRPQDAPARVVRLAQPIWLQAPSGAASILALPADRLMVTAATDFGRAFPGPCVYSFTLVDADEGFERVLAPARTFCFQDEVEALLAAGIGLGGSVENTVVVSETGTSTPLRFTDEMTRHKALDLLGDLGLVGARLAAHVIALRAGHTLHVAMADAIRQLVALSTEPLAERRERCNPLRATS